MNISSKWPPICNVWKELRIATGKISWLILDQPKNQRYTNYILHIHDVNWQNTASKYIKITSNNCHGHKSSRSSPGGAWISYGIAACCSLDSRLLVVSHHFSEEEHWLVLTHALKHGNMWGRTLLGSHIGLNHIMKTRWSYYYHILHSFIVLELKLYISLSFRGDFIYHIIISYYFILFHITTAESWICNYRPTERIEDDVVLTVVCTLWSHLDQKLREKTQHTHISVFEIPWKKHVLLLLAPSEQPSKSFTSNVEPTSSHMYPQTINHNILDQVHDCCLIKKSWMIAA